MIAIQIILILAFLALVVRFMANPNSHQMKAWQKILGLLFCMVAIYAVLLPDQLNRLANAVGVGRGADLLLYLLTLSFIFVVFNNYVHNRQEQKRLVMLARKLAIIEANQNPRNRALAGRD
jgi:small membrane protein